MSFGRFPAFCVMIAAMLMPTLAASAESRSRRTDPLSTIWNTKIRAEPGPVPDFVEKSRPAGEQGYIPLTSAQPKPPLKPKSADELKAMEAELNSAADANRRRAGRVPAGDAGKKPGKVLPLRSSEATPIH